MHEGRQVDSGEREGDEEKNIKRPLAENDGFLYFKDLCNVLLISAYPSDGSQTVDIQ